MKLLYATSNEAKLRNMRRKTASLPLEIISPQDIGLRLEFEEDGKTPIENAVLKAGAYHEHAGMPTVAGDSAMYIAGLPEEKQPGLHVRRAEGKELSDEELIAYYSALMEDCGGSAEAWYVTGLALFAEDGLHTVEIEEDRFILSSRRDISHPYRGNPLDVISIDPKCRKYYSEMTDEEIRKMGYKSDREVADFLKRFLIKSG